jgi:hypothetical protein
MLPGANTAARKNRSHKPGKNTATGTEISAIAKIRIPSATHPKTTAPVTIITLQSQPAAFPPSTASAPTLPIGISSRRKAMTEMMPKMIAAPMASAIFIPIFPA